MTKKEIYKQVFQILEEKRTKKILFAEKNRALAMSNPQYAQLDLDERVLNMELGRLKFEGVDLTEKAAEMQSIKNQKEASEMGINIKGE